MMMGRFTQHGLYLHRLTVRKVVTPVKIHLFTHYSSSSSLVHASKHTFRSWPVDEPCDCPVTNPSLHMKPNSSTRRCFSATLLRTQNRPRSATKVHIVEQHNSILEVFSFSFGYIWSMLSQEHRSYICSSWAASCIFCHLPMSEHLIRMGGRVKLLSALKTPQHQSSRCLSRCLYNDVTWLQPSSFIWKYAQQKYIYPGTALMHNFKMLYWYVVL